MFRHFLLKKVEKTGSNYHYNELLNEMKYTRALPKAWRPVECLASLNILIILRVLVILRSLKNWAILRTSLALLPLSELVESS